MNTHKILIETHENETMIYFNEDELVTDEIKNTMYSYADYLEKYHKILQTSYKKEIVGHKEAIAAMRTGKDLKEYYDFTQKQLKKAFRDLFIEKIKDLPIHERPNELDKIILILREQINDAKDFENDTSMLERMLESHLIEKEKTIRELNNPKPANKNDEGISRIFINNGYSIFEKLNKSFVRDNEKRADYNYMYWQMKKDSLIHKGVVPTEFLNWLKSNSFMDDNVKQLYSENRAYSKARKQLYSSIIN